MDDRIALRRADDLLMAFVQSQEIPGGGTTGTATEHGVKTAQFLIGLHKKLQVDIPETDYSRLRTLNDLLGYLGAKVA